MRLPWFILSTIASWTLDSRSVLLLYISVFLLHKLGNLRLFTSKILCARLRTLTLTINYEIHDLGEFENFINLVQHPCLSLKKSAF
jgi:hypothetical protein